MLSRAIVTGVGVIQATGQGKAAFADALVDGKHAFGVMQRPGRQRDSSYMGAEIGEITFPPSMAPRTLRASSLSGQAALVVLQEAWSESRLADVDPRRIRLSVGGSNFLRRGVEQILV